MSPAATQLILEPTPPLLLMEEGFGWRRVAHGPISVWLKGCLARGSAETVAAQAAAWPDPEDAEALRRWLLGLDGHFALVIAAPRWTLAAVDRVRSIPVAFARGADGWIVGASAAAVRARAGLGVADINREAALAIAMAGYTIDRETLHHGLEQLGPGEAALFAASGARVQRLRYHAYRPWRVEERNPDSLQRELRETTLGILEKAVSTLDGRPLAIPLSAGYDSRLIASAVHHLGCRDVLCFSYGQPGGHEAVTAKAVAEKLGFRWRFTPTTLRRQARYFASDTWRAFRDFSDDGTAIPFVQDMSAILDLRDAGYLPRDCVFMNGNSGDFISGLHIVPELRVARPGLDLEARRARVIDSLVKKHFSLWQHLRTPANLEAIGTRLWSAIEAAGGTLGAPETDHGLYECAEFQARQAKYVIKGQRTYEFLGHDWRLPLWDGDYLDFWERVPLSEKAGQALYARMLRQADWGGVWRDVPVNRRRIRPRWLAPLRLAAKAAHAPFGAAAWHRFEHRFFAYWMDGLGTAAIVPYRRVARDRRGARNAMSWLAEAYLASHRVSIDDLAGRSMAR